MKASIETWKSASPRETPKAQTDTLEERFQVNSQSDREPTENARTPNSQKNERDESKRYSNSPMLQSQSSSMQIMSRKPEPRNQLKQHRSPERKRDMALYRPSRKQPEQFTCGEHDFVIWGLKAWQSHLVDWHDGVIDSLCSHTFEGDMRNTQSRFTEDPTPSPETIRRPETGTGRNGMKVNRQPPQKNGGEKRNDGAPRNNHHDSQNKVAGTFRRAHSNDPKH